MAPTISVAVNTDCLHPCVLALPPWGAEPRFSMAYRVSAVVRPVVQQSLGLTPPEPRGSGFPERLAERLGGVDGQGANLDQESQETGRSWEIKCWPFFLLRP